MKLLLTFLLFFTTIFSNTNENEGKIRVVFSEIYVISETAFKDVSCMHSASAFNVKFGYNKYGNTFVFTNTNIKFNINEFFCGSPLIQNYVENNFKGEIDITLNNFVLEEFDANVWNKIKTDITIKINERNYVENITAFIFKNKNGSYDLWFTTTLFFKNFNIKQPIFVSPYFKVQYKTTFWLE